MQSIYYYSGSLTGSSLYLIPDNNNYGEYYAYDVTNLIVCSSLQQIMLYTGSNLLFAVPIENTNVYYIPTTESFFPPSPELIIPGGGEAITSTPNSSSFSYIFIPDSNIISSTNKLTITGSEISVAVSQSYSVGYFKINSGSSFSISISGSGQFYNAQLTINEASSSIIYITSSNAPLYTTLTASEFSNFYSIEARVYTTPYIEVKYDSVSNIPVSPTNSLASWSAYFNINPDSVVNSGSTVYLVGGNINEATVLLFTSSYQEKINVLGAKQLQYINISTGSLTSFPNLTNTPNLYFAYINNTQITSSNLPSDLLNLNTYDVSNNKISGSILDLVSNISQSIYILSCSYNNLTGSVPSMSAIPALGYLDCSNNQLSGSIISFSSSYGLYHFDCSDNALTGSIPGVNQLISLNYFDVSNNKLSGSIPTFSSSSFLEYLDLSNNQFSGSFIDLRNITHLSHINYSNNQITDDFAIFNKYAIGEEVNMSPSIEYYNCSYNFLSGTLDLSGSSTLLTFIANNNQFSGSLNDGEAGVSSLLGCTNLQYFDVSFNNLRGHLLNLPISTNLQYIDLYQNRFSGSIPDLSPLPSLTFFDCGRNNLIGNIPNLDSNLLLQQFSCQENDLSGSIPSLSNNTALFAFDASDNYLTGSIPDLSNNIGLVAFSVSNNELSGSIPDLSALSQLTIFNCALNNITGSIPNVNSNPVLAALVVNDNLLTGHIPYLGNTSMTVTSAANNQLTGYISGSVPATLKTFSAFNNQLSQPAVDGILEDLDNAGATGPGAFVYLFGGTNSTPSATGLTYKANLQAKGWTVLTN